jgi:hypothetical protein
MISAHLNLGITEEQRKRWVQLEESLVECARSLCQYAESKNVAFPSGFDITNERFLPKAFSYGQVFATKDESRRVVKLSCYAFQLLFAGISFVIASVMQDSDDLGHPSWAIYLQDVQHIEPTLLDQLKSSPLCDPTAKRIGAFIGDQLELGTLYPNHGTFWLPTIYSVPHTRSDPTNPIRSNE